MSVLEYFHSQKVLRHARAKIIDTLAPGGYLLVTSTRQHEVVEMACWDRWLLRGSQHIHQFLAQHPLLREQAAESTITHLFTLYRKEGS
jgi:hypothetical protein